jgi:hypothetical protein
MVGIENRGIYLSTVSIDRNIQERQTHARTSTPTYAYTYTYTHTYAGRTEQP